MNHEEIKAKCAESKAAWDRGEHNLAALLFAEARGAAAETEGVVLEQNPDGTIVVPTYTPHDKLLGETVRTWVEYQ